MEQQRFCAYSLYPSRDGGWLSFERNRSESTSWWKQSSAHGIASCTRIVSCTALSRSFSVRPFLATYTRRHIASVYTAGILAELDASIHVALRRANPSRLELWSRHSRFRSGAAVPFMAFAPPNSNLPLRTC